MKNETNIVPQVICGNIPEMLNLMSAVIIFGHNNRLVVATDSLDTLYTMKDLKQIFYN